MLRTHAAVLLTSFRAACAASAGDGAATSESADTAARPRLLALGDSITFAWDPHVESDLHKVDPTRYSGYAELLGSDLGLAVDNAACPGETSGAVLDAHAEDNGCRANRATYPLHYPWSAPTGETPATQIDFARAYLAKAVAAGSAPELVTMTIGGNDLLVLQKHCALPGPLAAGCEITRLPFDVHAYGDHLESIVRALDEAGYQGTFVAITTYAPDYSDGMATFGLQQMNGEMSEHVLRLEASLHGMRVRVADGYGAFAAAAAAHGGTTCETGLLIANGDGTCDIHPSPAGHRVLADAVRRAIGR